MINLTHLYLFSPLHTGGTTQEGNLVGIARESHTNLPYLPSSTIRGKIRSTVTNQDQKFKLFGNELGEKNVELKQGEIWIGDGSILWIPVPSLSHGVIWITSPLLLRRYANLTAKNLTIPDEYSCNFNSNSMVYLKDARFNSSELKEFKNPQDFIPDSNETKTINKVLVLPDNHCSTLIQMSLWRQVKIKLDQSKCVDGGFRYEEAIPPDTLMYFPWGTTSQANGSSEKSFTDFQSIIKTNEVLQIGGQESLGRGFCKVI
jgi:CRISPR-associated protein Cmr4